MAQKVEDRIETKLEALGFAYNANNYCKYECTTYPELVKMMQQLTVLGFSNAEVGFV